MGVKSLELLWALYLLLKPLRCILISLDFPCDLITFGLSNFTERLWPQKAADGQSPPLTEVVTPGPITVFGTDARWQHWLLQSSSAGAVA